MLTRILAALWLVLLSSCTFCGIFLFVLVPSCTVWWGLLWISCASVVDLGNLHAQQQTGVFESVISFKKIILPCAEVFPLAGDLMDKGLRVRFTVSGSSMWPLIRHNTDSVLLASQYRPVHVGDIVLARLNAKPARYILHRVMKVKGSTCITAGDNCIHFDGMIPLDNIVGFVEKVYRGTKVITCNSPIWRAFFGIWRVMFPFRPYLLRGVQLAGKFYKALRSILTII